jgi:hypothetical protein
MDLSVESLLRQISTLKRNIQDQNEKISLLKAENKNTLRKYNFYKFETNNTTVKGTSISAIKKKKKRIKDVFTVINEDLIKVGYRLDTCLDIKKTTTFQNQGVSASNLDINFIEESLDTSTTNMNEKSLYCKDKAGIPDRKYHAFRKLMGLKKKIGTLYSVKRLRKKKAARMNIKPMSTGFYIDPVGIIKQKILAFLNSLKEGETPDKIKIKLACDGTNISRNVKLVNFAFSIINEKNKAATAKGCYRLGIFRLDKEDYASTKSWLPVLWSKIKILNRIYFDPVNKSVLDDVELANFCRIGNIQQNQFVEIEIDYAFCNDYKMNLIVLGLKAANSKWPCIYCTQSKDQLHLCGKKHAK